MPYHFLPEWPGAVEPSLRMLDGDVHKVTVIDPTPDEFGFAFDFGPPSRTGRHVNPEFVPTKVQFGARKGTKLPDIDTIHGAFISVSRRIKDPIEKLELGVHQFISSEYYWKDGSLADQRWVFVCGNRIKALHDEKTTLESARTKGLYKPGDGGEMVFSSENIGNRSFWVSADLLGDYVYMSDEAHQVFVETGVTGLRLGADRHRPAA